MMPSNITMQATNAPGGDYSSGERVVPAFACLYPPAIDAHDLLLVDFDRHSVEYGALYLVEEIEAGKVVWMGCRRFDRQPGKTTVDVTGKGDWRILADLPAHWRIAGEVKQVFKPSMRGEIMGPKEVAA